MNIRLTTHRAANKVTVADLLLVGLRIFAIVICSYSATVTADAIPQVTYVHTDYLGSVVMETSSTGAVLKRFHRRPYGQADGVEANDEPSYTGHVYDDDLGLVYMQQRYYSPIAGRFFSVDPVKHLLDEPMTFNRYAYAANNPFTYIDPEGELFWFGAIWAWITGGTAAATTTSVVAGTAVRVGTTTVLRNQLANGVGIAGLTVLANETSSDSDSSDESSGDSSGESSGEGSGTRKLGDLETIHDPDHVQNDPAIGQLTDEQLENALNNPENGDKVTVKGNSVRDGNTRVNEAKKRGFSDDMTISVDELHNPTIDPNDPLGGYGEY